MHLRWLTATSFALLEGVTLELDDGMTLIVGPNSSGKSTWHAALYAALCGIPSASDRRREDQEFVYEHSVAGSDWTLEFEIELRGGHRFKVERDLQHNIAHVDRTAGQGGPNPPTLPVLDYTSVANIDRYTYAATGWVDHETSEARDPHRDRLLRTLRAHVDYYPVGNAVKWLDAELSRRQAEDRVGQAQRKLDLARQKLAAYEAAREDLERAELELQRSGYMVQTLTERLENHRRFATFAVKTPDPQPDNPIPRASGAFLRDTVSAARPEPMAKDSHVDPEIDGAIDAAAAKLTQADTELRILVDRPLEVPVTQPLASARPAWVSQMTPAVIALAAVGALGVVVGLMMLSLIGLGIAVLSALIGVAGFSLLRQGQPATVAPPERDTYADQRGQRLKMLQMRVVEAEDELALAMSKAGLNVQAPNVRRALTDYRGSRQVQQTPRVPDPVLPEPVEPQVVETPLERELNAAIADQQVKAAAVEDKRRQVNQFDAYTLRAEQDSAQAQVGRSSIIDQALAGARHAFVRGGMSAYRRVTDVVSNQLKRHLMNVINDDALRAEIDVRDDELHIEVTELDWRGRRHRMLSGGPRQAANVFTCIAFSDYFEGGDERTPLILDDVASRLNSPGPLPFFEELLDISRQRQVILFANYDKDAAAQWVQEKRRANRRIKLVELTDVRNSPVTPNTVTP